MLSHQESARQPRKPVSDEVEEDENTEERKIWRERERDRMEKARIKQATECKWNAGVHRSDIR